MNRAAKAYSLVIATTLMAAAAAAPAQAADPTPCTPQEKSNQTLGEKLNQANGVICPPDVDPAMKAPTPKGSDPAVIAPPGSRGGDQNVQPK
jgi:hypothetical protein